MKLPVRWIAATAWFFLFTHPGHAQDASGRITVAGMPGLHIFMPSSQSPAPMTLAPGFYVAAGLGAQTGGQEPRAMALHITALDASHFSGTLEILRLDRDGTFIHMSSRFDGAIGMPGITSSPGKLVISPTSPLSMNLKDEPLRSLVVNMEGHLLPDVIWLGWQTPSKQLRGDEIGSYAEFVSTTEDGYKQVVAQYQEMATYKTQLMKDQASSAQLVESRINDYMQSTDYWLNATPDNNVAVIEAEAKALYESEKKLLSNGSANSGDVSRRRATMLAMQIDAYRSQMEYVSQRQRKEERYLRGQWTSLQYLIENSPCMEETSTKLDYAVSPACDVLPALYSAAQLRQKEVTQRLGKLFESQRQAQDVFGCLWSGAHNLADPKHGVFPYCEKLPKPAVADMKKGVQ
jgi:hypothetical protein